MKLSKIFALLLALCLISSAACAATFTDAHGNVIELADSLEAYAAVTLVGADNAARQGETNLGDLWADALRWFAVSGEINAAFDEDDVKAGNDRIAVDADHVVALWNGGNLRADIAEGTFGAEALAEVLPFPNKVAVVYMTGAQLLETLEAASQGLPYGGNRGRLRFADAGLRPDLYRRYGKGLRRAGSLRRPLVHRRFRLPRAHRRRERPAV